MTNPTSNGKHIIETTSAPAAIGTYSQGVRTGNLLFISGQIPLDPTTAEIVSQDFVEQAHQVFKNLIAVADAGKSDLKNAVKLGVFLTDLNDFAQLNEVMSQYIEAPYPARAAIEVSALPRGVKIEIDAVLICDED